MTSEYLELVLRGIVIVGLVSWQTVNIQRGSPGRIAVGAFMVGVAWWVNAHSAATFDGSWGWAAYAVGSAAGAVAGTKVGHG